MTYLEIKEKIESAIKANDVEAVLSLMNFQNAKEVKTFLLRQNAKTQFYESVRNVAPQFKKMTDEDLHVLFDTDISEKEKQDRLKKLGIETPKPKKDNTEWLLSQK